MSIYCKIGPLIRNTHDLSSDVYAIATIKTSSVQRIAPQIGAQLDEHQRLRKATPANIPLRRTLEWVESLPPRVRPRTLLRQFARIANLIAAAWDDLEAFEPYLEALLTDKRGNRKGFPPDVVEELSALEVYRLAIEAGASRNIRKPQGALI